MPDSDAPGRRGRGSRAGITLSTIVAAARDVQPEDFTMQAVADRLGVDRKALHHHVTDRDGLLRLVAAANFEQNFLDVDLNVLDWRVAVRQYAMAVRAGMIAIGRLIDYYQFDPAPDHPSFAAVEMVLQRLLDAGLDDDDAGRTLILLTTSAMASARDVIIETADHVHPQSPEVRRALLDVPDGAYSALRRLVDAQPVRDHGAQFAFDLEILIGGVEQRRSGFHREHTPHPRPRGD